MITREQRIAMAISHSKKKKGVIAQETGISAGFFAPNNFSKLK